jgi:hypothetical protein
MSVIEDVSFGQSCLVAVAGGQTPIGDIHLAV